VPDSRGLSVALPAVAMAQVSRAEQIFSGKLGNEYRIQMRLRK